MLVFKCAVCSPALAVSDCKTVRVGTRGLSKTVKLLAMFSSRKTADSGNTLHTTFVDSSFVSLFSVFTYSLNDTTPQLCFSLFLVFIIIIIVIHFRAAKYETYV